MVQLACNGWLSQSCCVYWSSHWTISRCNNWSRWSFGKESVLRQVQGLLGCRALVRFFISLQRMVLEDLISFSFGIEIMMRLDSIFADSECMALIWRKLDSKYHLPLKERCSFLHWYDSILSQPAVHSEIQLVQEPFSSVHVYCISTTVPTQSCCNNRIGISAIIMKHHGDPCCWIVALHNNDMQSWCGTTVTTKFLFTLGCQQPKFCAHENAPLITGR